MREVHRFEDVILLSDKEVSNAEGSLVRFTDGSVADLDQLAFRNRGTGEIAFRWASNHELPAEARSETYEFENSSEVIFQGGDLYFEVTEGSSQSPILEVIGTDSFHSSVDIYETAAGLAIRTPERRRTLTVGSVFVNGRRVKGDPIEGKFNLRLPPTGPSVYVQNTGRGHGQIRLPVGLLDVEIDGCFELEAVAVRDLEVRITGSGDVRVQEVTKSCKAEISGSGSVKISSGELPEADLRVSGSGDIEADITVQRARLVLQGSGSIKVGHVIEESLEVHCGSGTVTVHKRGIS
ncbi:MAG: hypothetical protein GX492_03615 [Firmicutes bacterium]|nr:hypothetical protein [Bacillota bacterium]